MAQQQIIKHVTTNDRGERYCSHHLRYTSAIGGIEKPTRGGLRTRWICQKCVDAHEARKKKLTEKHKVITTCAQPEEVTAL